jgi:hypothetical protein
MVAFEGVFVIHYVTRFAEEIFAFLISLVFLSDAFKRVVKVVFLCFFIIVITLIVRYHWHFLYFQSFLKLIRSIHNITMVQVESVNLKNATYTIRQVTWSQRQRNQMWPCCH